MRGVLWRIFGVPFGAADRSSLFATLVGGRTEEAAVDFLRANASHNTEKSGALLGAQGIFVVVDIFAIDHGWPRAAILPALILLLVGALVVMTNLRGTLAVYRPTGSEAPGGHARAVFQLVLSRTLRFNAALYLTFLSIILLGVAALAPAR
jgi:hypothetical protein